ncbi:nesprin-1 isoform X5 [Phyllopteryx taeniolatus]|uniref:nesprin-1 isoform X5 n=1 Tax=Phyllopteryx taeniolatus TaxID=161469 RepID=UPI002AD49EE1|nr:nesprin-1 isoform X5 [Phyllopteryx taeniolatus]
MTDGVKQIFSQLQFGSQTVEAEPSQPGQASNLSQVQREVASKVVPSTPDNDMEIKHIFSSNSKTSRHHASTESTMHSLDALNTEQACKSVQQQAEICVKYTSDRFMQIANEDAFHPIRFPCPDISQSKTTKQSQALRERNMLQSFGPSDEISTIYNPLRNEHAIIFSTQCPSSEMCNEARRDCGHPAKYPETLKLITDEEKPHKDIRGTPTTMFTTVMDMQNIEEAGDSGSDAALCCKGAESKNDKMVTSLQRKHEMSTSEQPESDVSRVSSSDPQSSTRCGNTKMCQSKSTSGKSQFSTYQEVWKQMPESSGLTQLNLADSDAKDTFPHAKSGEITDNSHPEEQTTRYKYLIPQRCCDSSMAEVESEFLLSLEAREMAEVGTEMSSIMNLEELASDQEKTCESPGQPSCKHSSTMQELLSEIQGTVERNSIINRTTRMDLNWYLQSSPSEAEIRLVRAVQNVLVCRYLPAQLNVAAMAKQLEKAEDYKICVLDQVAMMKSTSSFQLCGPNVLKSLEAQWSTALLDASATVQVKTAQLGEVKQYHKQLDEIKAFLDVVHAEKKKLNLLALGSSALQAEKLHSLLQTLKQSEEMWQELLVLSSQLAVHLSDAESSGALLAQLGDVQDEWRLLSGSIKRALWQAANSSCQSSVIMKDARQLKEKIEAIQESMKSHGICHDTKSTLELFCLSEDLKMCNQLHVNLQSFSDALFQFSIDQKEKDSIKHDLAELGTLLGTTKNKADTSLCGADVNKRFQEWITWAKHMEYQITIGKKLSLFPEEARIQIVEMRKFQTDIMIRKSKMKLEEMRGETPDMDNEEYGQGLKVVEHLYGTITESLDNVLDTMKKNLHEREKLLDHLDSIDTWLVETKGNRDSCAYVENVSRVDISSLESKLKRHQDVADDIERHLSLVDALETRSKEVAEDLSPGESRYLVNRLSGIWTEFDGLRAQESSTSWHLEELIHERTSSGEELSTIEDSLKNISSSLDQHHFPMTQETILTIALLKHMLMEHQCQVQEIQHCQEVERSSLLCTIGELQDRCKVLSFQAFEQDKYLQLKKQMEDSRDISEEKIQQAKDGTLSLGERFKLCQALLVDLPMMKTQCQEAADQLEVIAQELKPTEMNLERQSIRCTVEMFVSWEHTASNEIKHLEGTLLLGLRFSSELPALMEFFQRTAQELQGMEPVSPDERALDFALQRRWVIWRNMESGMRVLHALAWKGKINLKSHSDLHLLRDAAMQECHLQMECLSKTRESLKDYQWAAQGAIYFLHNAEMTFLSAPGGFLDCTEEQTQTQQALEALKEGFVAHIKHLVELVPQQVCLSCSKTQDLHIGILSQLLVGRAILEVQAQLRLESLQRCALRQQSHRVCHEDIQQHLTEFEAKLSACEAEEVTSYDKCVLQHKRSKGLMEGVCDLARKTEELRARCPMQGCGVGKDGELSALWRRWVSLRRGVALLMTQADQRVEEWKDITTTVEQCCNSLSRLQAKVPDSSTANFTQGELQKLLAQAEMQQVGLEHEQQTLASLEHRLEHALRLTTSKDPSSLPGPFGVMLVKIQENIKRLKERNLHVIAVAQIEERERQEFEERIGEVEKSIFTILPMLDNNMSPAQHQELTQDLSNQRVKLKCILDIVLAQYAEIPDDIGKRMQTLQESVEEAEKKVIEQSVTVRKLACQVTELISGLEQVKISLEQKSATVTEAQHALKHVWDKLDSCHSRLMLLESEVQDLVEEQSDRAHLFMDQLTRPLQLYQDAVQMAEHRTAFLSKIPASLQEFEDLLWSATCWFDEATAWLNTPCSFPTSKGLQNHAKSLKLVLDDSARITTMLKDFRPVLAEISAVCDVGAQEERMDSTDQKVEKMQKNILEPMEQLNQAVELVEALEDELRTFEENVPKIRTILSSIDNSSITVKEHLQNQQVILDNVHSMQKTLEEMERYKGDLPLPQEATESLVVFSGIKVLLQVLKDLKHLTQEQAILLEDRHAKPCAEVSHLDGAKQTFSVQDAFEESNSEDDLDEDESCHSSSSDTLTCSIPEDPEETLCASEVKRNEMTDMEALSDAKALANVCGQFSEPDSEVEAMSNSNESSVLHTKMLEQENAQSGLITPETRLDTEADSGEVLGVKIVTPESLITSTISANEDHSTAVVTEDDSTLPDFDIFVPTTNVLSNQAAVQHISPVSLFSATRKSTATHPNRLKERSELTISACQVEVDQHDYKPSAASIILAGPSKDDTEQQQWSLLNIQVSQKLETLQNLKEDHKNLINYRNFTMVPEGELLSPGSASAVLQHANESIAVLRKIVSSADAPGVKDHLYLATRRVLQCLDALTDLLLTPGGVGDQETQLRILQHECVSNELMSLAGLLNEVASKISPVLQSDGPDALSCLTSLQKCLKNVPLVITSFNDLSLDSLVFKSQHQLCFMEEIQLGHHEIFPSQKEIAILEQCALGRHGRESSEEKTMIQKVSQSLLHGISSLLDLGEGCIAEEQLRPVQNISQLHICLHKNKKFQQVLGAQLTFMQHLSNRNAEVLRGKEDEQAQLAVRGKALLQQALQQEVASQLRLQEWIRWEDNCGRLGRLLDKLDVCISSAEAEGTDDEESHIKHRLHACQQTLVQLEANTAALGLLLDQRCELQTDPSFAPSISHAGGALELRWRSICSRTEQEVRRCSDIWDSWVRFQTDFGSVSKWLLDANKELTIWSELTDTSNVSQESVYRVLIQLLDFSIEMETMSAHKQSATREATRLLRLRETECPGLRGRLTKMEITWCKLTSDLRKIQGQLQQKLLLMWPPMKLLSDLEDWLKKLDVQLEKEREKVHKATDAAHIRRTLQRYQALKMSLLNGQPLLEFLSQTCPQVMGVDVQALCEQTIYGEQLGDLRQRWLHLQGALDNQIHRDQELHYTCTARERQLQHFRRSVEQQKKHLNHCKHPVSQAQTQKVLQESEAVVGRIKEVVAALQGVKNTRVLVEKEHPCDVAFCNQAETVSLACEDLSQQIQALTPALQKIVKEWVCLDRNLREVSLHTSRVHCTMQLYRAPLLSLKQTQGYLELLQQLQEMGVQGKTLWADINKSLQILLKTLDGATTQLLNDQIEQERKRWEDMLEKLKEEHQKTDETLTLWQQYNHAFDNASRQLEHLRCQFSSVSPQQESQNFAMDLQNSVVDMLALSKPLVGCLKPPVQNLVQSESMGLSLEVLLLNQGMSDTKKNRQEDLDNHKLFHTQLEALEQQTQNILHGEKSNMNEKDIVKQELLKLIELLPSLVDVSEMSSYMTLNKLEKDTLHMHSKKWNHGVNHMSSLYRILQREHQQSQDFHQKCQELIFILEELESELPRGFNLQEILAVHQRRQIEMITGQEILQSLLCNAVKSMEKQTWEKKSEFLTQVVHLRERWFRCLLLAGQHQAMTREQIYQWRIYKGGMKLLRKTLRTVETLLSSACSSITLFPVTSQQLSDHCQCLEKALELHSSMLTETLGAGRHLCETMSDSDSRSQLESDIQAIEGAWKHTNSLVLKRRALISTTVQNWSQCQDEINTITCELDELRTQMKRKLPVTMEESEEEELLQKTDLSLRHLAGGLKDLASKKTDLCQYVAVADSALLEQQLEQLHIQWEELCTKVSLRRQEIADRLNAWTIFNDKNKEFCDWLTQIENKVCHSADLSIEEMVEKLKKDCMEEINLFSENKSHLKHLGEQLLLASDEAKQTQVRGSLQEVNQRWHNLFSHIEARVTKLKETLLRVQQLDKNMSNLRSWLSRVEAELSRPITYSVCHHQEIQRRLAEQQELQRDIEQHTEGVTSVLNLCDLLLRDEDAIGATEVESDSLQETSHSLDQRWRTICAMALDRRLRIEETWRQWCKFLKDYSHFEDWLKVAEKTAANPNSGDVLYAVAKEELKKFETFQRQVHERLTQLELVNNQYRRLARENRTDRANQLKVMVHEGNRRWDVLHRRVAAILRRLKHFTSQREEFEGTRESMLVWLTELDLQLTNVEHFSESDVHHKIKQLSSFQKEIILNTERIDGLIVFGESLIQRSSPQDAALIEEELEELHSYCQEVFSRLVRFHQRLSQPPMITEEPEFSGTSISLESSLELIGRPWLGRSQGSLPTTPSHLLALPMEHSGRETPVSVDSLPLEWDHTGDVGGSSSHEDDEDDEGHDEEGIYFSALSESERSKAAYESPRWRSPGDEETAVCDIEAPPTLTSTPVKQGYLHQMSQCSDNIEDIKRVSLILDDEEQPEIGLTNLAASDKQSGVIERWELLQAQCRNEQDADRQDPQNVTSEIDDVISWLDNIHLELDRHQQSHRSNRIVDMATRAKEMKEMQKMFTRYKPIMLSVNLRALEVPEQQERLIDLNRAWSRASTLLHQWDTSLRRTLMRCQEFQESLHSLLLWLAHTENRRYAVDIRDAETPVPILKQHHHSLTALLEELLERQTQQASLQTLWCQLQPEEGDEGSDEAQEKIHVTGTKLKLLLKDVTQDLSILQQRLQEWDTCRGQNIPADCSQELTQTKKSPSTTREKNDSSPPRSFFCRVLRAAVPFHLLLLFLLLLPCLLPQSERDSSCTVANNFARSFHPMLHYTNGPPPT